MTFLFIPFQRVINALKKNNSTVRVVMMLLYLEFKNIIFTVRRGPTTPKSIVVVVGIQDSGIALNNNNRIKPGFALKEKNLLLGNDDSLLWKHEAVPVPVPATVTHLTRIPRMRTNTTKHKKNCQPRHQNESFLLSEPEYRGFEYIKQTVGSELHVVLLPLLLQVLSLLFLIPTNTAPLFSIS